MRNKLLLADDSVTIQKVVGIIFSSEEYDLTVVDNGNAALEKAREVRPDIMLVDAIMPGRNGYEVCQEIRRDPDLKNTSLLLLTGAFEPFDEDKARQCGADDFISKPFDSQSLIESVKKLITVGRDRVATPGGPIPTVLATEPVFISGGAEPAVFESVPAFAAAPPEADLIPEPAPAVAEDDLWGVFELEEGGVAEPGVRVAEAEATMEGFSEPVAADAFSFAEPEPFLEQPVMEPAAPDFSSTWVPVGEQEFRYDEPTPGEPAPSLATEPFPDVAAETVEPSSFAESSFTGSVEEAADFGGFEGLVEPMPAESAIEAEPFEQVFAPEEEYVPAPVTVAQPETAAGGVSAAAIPATVALDEEQLRILLASVSREVIERIVWEVVPDLAETIIKEEIRKIKAGVGE